MSIGELMKCLRDKGWIPRGYNEVIHAVYDKRYKMIGLYKEGKKYLHLVYKKSLRELVSKESLLWQFVCENKLYSRQAYVWLTNIEGFNDEFGDNDYQFRLMESSLKDESEIEQFLLDNIKIGND